MKLRMFLICLSLSLGLFPVTAASAEPGIENPTGPSDASDDHTAQPGAAAPSSSAGPAAPAGQLAELSKLLAEQRQVLEAQAKAIEEQREALAEQRRRTDALEAEIESLRGTSEAPGSPSGVESAAARPDLADGAMRMSGPVNPPQAPADASQIEGRLTSLEQSFERNNPFLFSGDFRLRSEPILGGPSDGSQDRTRERYRVRLNVDARLGESFTGGISLASGDIGQPISTNQTTNQFFARKPFFLDKAFAQYEPRELPFLTLVGGKFAYPWYSTELTWDKDLNPEGVAEKLDFDVKTGPLEQLNLVAFQLPFAENHYTTSTNKSYFNSMLYGGQVQMVFGLPGGAKLSGYSAYYDWQNADAVAFALLAPAENFSVTNGQSPLEGLLALEANGEMNSIATVNSSANGVATLRSANFASRFGLFDNILRLDLPAASAKWPLRVIGDYVQNTRACSNGGSIPSGATLNFPCIARERRGYWLEARAGETKKKGDWEFSYTRIYADREAVLGAFNYSELRASSNVTAHRVELFYEAANNVQLAWTGIFARPINSPGTTAEPFTERLQFDVTYFFGAPPEGRKRK